MVDSTCQYCGCTFESVRPSKYCSASHRAAEWAARNPERVAARWEGKYTARTLGVPVVCVVCGEEFRAKISSAKYCAQGCRAKAKSDAQRATVAGRPPRERKLVDSTCQHCGVTFQSARASLHCSATHRSAAWAAKNPDRIAAREAKKHTHRRLGVSVQCVECDGSFLAKKVDAKYCSQRCRNSLERRMFPDRVKARRRRSTVANADKQRQWVAANREAVRAISRASYHRRKHDDDDRRRAMLSLRAHDRRVRELGVQSVKFTQPELMARYAFFGFRCWMCSRGDVPLHMDHVKPVSRGGSHMLSNIRPACKPCNSSKHNRWLGVEETLRLAG